MNYKVKLGEKLAFAMGDVGCNFIWTVVGSFLTMYYTDSVGITAGVVGTIMLVTRILDGFPTSGWARSLTVPIRAGAKQDPGFSGLPR